MEEVAETSSDGAPQQYLEVTDEAEGLADELISLANKHGRVLIHTVHSTLLIVKHRVKAGEDRSMYERVFYLDDEQTYVVCALGLGRARHCLFGFFSYAKPVARKATIVALGSDKLRLMVERIKSNI
jgi:hypothetical protein